jgi:lipopolysaccharide/colanic/teichoic acid biosynthesis glycosyltransferase
MGTSMAWPTLSRHIEPQDQFLQRIAFEWRRAERSGKPALLVLLRGLDRLNEKRAPLVEKLCSVCRETDICGWFEPDCALGILCLELGKCKIEEARRAIVTKITACVKSTGVWQANAIRITAHALPPYVRAEAIDKQNQYVADAIWSAVCTPHPLAFAILRTCDICLSLALLIMAFPVLLTIAVCIRVSSRGPAFYRQIRIGQNGRTFCIYKFRTMESGTDDSRHRDYVRRFIRGDAEQHVDDSGHTVFKLTNDARITRVGKWLRRTSLDELPQLWNVLKGEMSLAGPRPPLAYEVESYDLWHRRRVYEIKPGLTGRWQVRGRSRCSFDEMIRMDLEHGKPHFLSLYFRTLLETPRAVLLGHGAQ